MFGRGMTTLMRKIERECILNEWLGLKGRFLFNLNNIGRIKIAATNVFKYGKDTELICVKIGICCGVFLVSN